MTVRRQLPWPLRWAAGALSLGFSAALALWAFEFGRDLAGLDGGLRQRLVVAQEEIDELRQERDRAQSLANAADTLLRAERATQDRLAAQVRALEGDNLALKGDLGFFEKLMPIEGKQQLAVRGLQAEIAANGRLRYQLLLMQGQRAPAEFSGRYELSVSGQLGGQGWSQPAAGGARQIRFRQYQRVEGELEIPPQAVVQNVHVRVLDAGGGVRAEQNLRL